LVGEAEVVTVRRDEEVLGAGTSQTMAAAGGEKMKGEVVWEVEMVEERATNLEGAFVGFLVEDKEASLLQNNFRMNGFQSLRVTKMGYSQVLLWSDKRDEVKEVVGTVGWWCSLFERVVPWLPELVSNTRVSWLRCHGVPTHAWGNDLFRALSFKYGRFIDVDEDTKTFRRCDVARVKVMTKEPKIIDSSMVIKVEGKRFEIRVIEETVDTLDVSGGFTKVGPGWQEEQWSKASHGGGSNCAAAAEGCFSESGSDVDVLESCQVLLELQAHGVDRNVTQGPLEDYGYTVEEMSGNIPNLLGKNVVGLVNEDSDRCVDSFEEVGVAEQVLGAVPTIGRSGAQVEVGETQDDVGDTPVLPSADGDELVGQVVYVEDKVIESEGCEEESGKRQEFINGPIILRTRKGDLSTNGPVHSVNKNSEGAQTVLRPKEGSKVQLPLVKKSSLAKASVSVMANPDLPFSMLRKLPGSIHYMGRRKKKSKKAEGGDKELAVLREEEDSNSIHDSDSSEQDSIPSMGAPEGIVLEVVLPSIPGVGNENLTAAGRQVSGATLIANIEGAEGIQSREVVEATKLCELAEEVGLKFHGDAGANISRMLVMEERDAGEKEE
jgi:hypothetical protein